MLSIFSLCVFALTCTGSERVRGRDCKGETHSYEDVARENHTSKTLLEKKLDCLVINLKSMSEMIFKSLI